MGCGASEPAVVHHNGNRPAQNAYPRQGAQQHQQQQQQHGNYNVRNDALTVQYQQEQTYPTVSREPYQSQTYRRTSQLYPILPVETEDDYYDPSMSSRMMPQPQVFPQKALPQPQVFPQEPQPPPYESHVPPTHLPPLQQRLTSPQTLPQSQSPYPLQPTQIRLPVSEPEHHDSTIVPTAPPFEAKSQQHNDGPIVVDEALVERFLQIQAQIENYDKIGVFDALVVCEEQFEALRRAKGQAEVTYKVLCEKTKKEKMDFEAVTKVVNIGTFFKDKEAQNRAISKEEQEYIQAMNQEEIALNELKSLKQQLDSAKAKLEDFRRTNENAIKLNNELSFILTSVYNGPYGSENENRLETEIVSLGEQKNILQKALHKWSNSRFLLVYAYNQIQCAEERWKDLMGLDLGDNSKVLFATEVRNNLLAANQNLSNTRNYLTNVELPYCTDDDLRTIQSLSQGIYNDMLSFDRQRYVLDIIQVLRKRCASLCQWMDQVIKESISVEFNRTKVDYDMKVRQLKQERINLMQEKIKETTGKTVKIKIHVSSRVAMSYQLRVNRLHVNSGPSELHSDSNLYCVFYKLLKDIKNQQELEAVDFNPVPNRALDVDGTQTELAIMDIAEQPVSVADLPPPPSRDQILGNVEMIKQKYRQHVDELNKNLDDNRREADEKLNRILQQYNK